MSHHTLYSDRLESQFHVLHRERERERERERNTHTHAHTYTQKQTQTQTHICLCLSINVCMCVLPSRCLSDPSRCLSPRKIFGRSRLGFGLYTDKFPTPSLVECEHWNSNRVTHTPCPVHCSVLQCLVSGNAHINTEISIWRIILCHFAIGPASPPCSIAATATNTATIASGREGIIIIRYVRASVFVIRVGGGCPVRKRIIYDWI